MFYPSRNTHPLIGLFIYFLAIVFIQSCETSHFLVPQPIDQKNIETFPKAFRGQWYVDDEEGAGSYLISKKNVSIIFNDTDKIVNGYWPRKDNNGSNIWPPFSFTGFNSINYDSLKNPIDTVANYFIKDQLIYEMEFPRFLSKGYPFYTIDDSIKLLKKDTICIDLGKNAFLRKLNSRFYMLNIRNRILGESRSEINDWWQLSLIETTGRSSFNIWESTEKLKNLPCMFFPKDSVTGNYFYNCRWTTEDVLSLIKEGYFDVSNSLYKKDD